MQGFCFACQYATASSSKGPYDELMELIGSKYGQVSNNVLVEMVHTFYEQEIRRHYNYPEWRRRAIWNHIHVHMQDEHTQTCESIQCMTLAMEHLRNAGICTRMDQSINIDHKSMRLYLELCKTRDALINSKLKRRNV